VYDAEPRPDKQAQGSALGYTIQSIPGGACKIQHMKAKDLASQFESVYGDEPEVFGAPGRVNLIGEHTDYNQGFVMPSALGFRTRVAMAPRRDHKLLLRSTELPDQFEFDVNDLPSRRVGAWCDYVLGVALMLQQMGYPVQGANLLVHGEVPIGAGLSSSAALEVASALAFTQRNHIHLAPVEVAQLCQAAENSFVGARVGIMDQFVACLGKVDHALLLDCRSLEFSLIPLPQNLRIVVCNTKVKHELASSEYNRRREECEQGVKLLSRWYPNVQALRDITVAELERHREALPATVYKRCAHVVNENKRVLEGAELLAAGQLGRFGELMRESHRSLRDLYEVSCLELDIMVESAEGLPGYWGGRMTGGGFGGCTVNLVNAADAEIFSRQIAERYQTRTGIRPDVYVCFAANGAEAESPAISGTHPAVERKV
jgi:galactokinase